MTYVVITFVVLLFLNIYCSRISQRIFYLNKESAMLEKCHLASSEIAKLDVVNPSTVSNLISQMESLKVTRMIVTDQSGLTLYDSSETALGTYALLPVFFPGISTKALLTPVQRSPLFIMETSSAASI